MFGRKGNVDFVSAFVNKEECVAVLAKRAIYPDEVLWGRDSWTDYKPFEFENMIIDYRVSPQICLTLVTFLCVI